MLRLLRFKSRVKLQELVIVDGCGEVIGVDTRIRDQVLNPEDEATLAYSLNI